MTLEKTRVSFAACTRPAATDAVLGDPSSNDLRPYPLLRRAIAAHTPVGRGRMTPKVYEESLRAGYAVVPVEKLSGDARRCTAEFQLPA